MKVVWLSLGYLCHSGRGVDRNGELTIPVISGELASPDQIHRALEPAWRSLVEERNDAGLVGPKDEGKPQPPLSAEEAAFQYERVQKGEVDSARLLLVFGMVPSVRHVDNDTIGFLAEDRDKAIGNGDQAVERMDDEDWRHAPAILDANTRYADGSTALHMAATCSLLRSVRHFLKAGADVNTTSNMGLQPIHNAAIMGHSAAVELLVRHKADVNARHRFAGSTPLHFAAEMGHHQLVRSLCELGADVEAEKRHGGTAIHVSADTNNAAVTRALIEAPCGADPDAALLGDTVPLYLAAGRGFHEVIDVLIEAGANPDRTLWPQRPWHSKNKKSRKATPATETKELTVTAQVLPGSDPSAAGWEEGNGATSLHNACENGRLKAVLALLEGGARQLATMQGVTPLITSLQYRHPKIAVALLDSTTPANVAVASPADGQTALHLAAAYDFPEVVARILMSFGGRTDVRDHQGNVALDYARGRLTRWLLGRFQGRDPELDAVVRSASPNELEHLLSATAASPEVQELYMDFARRHREGNLVEEASRLAASLSSGSELARGERDVQMRRFTIARFILAGSDVPIAVEAMMQKTEAALHVGLVLLRIRVDSLRYMPDSGELTVNGRTDGKLMDDIMRTAQHGDAEEVGKLIEELRRKLEGRTRRSVLKKKSGQSSEVESQIEPRSVSRILSVYR